MDFEYIENRLIECFNVSSDQVWYFGKNIQTGLLEYSLKLDSFNPQLNSRWAKYFPAGSYSGISKESNQKMLTLIITISENDYSEIFHFNNLSVKNGRVLEIA
jgi:hypothetical protein